MTKSPRTLHSLVWAKGGGEEEGGKTHERVVLFSLCGSLGGLLVSSLGSRPPEFVGMEPLLGCLLCTYACIFWQRRSMCVV